MKFSTLTLFVLLICSSIVKGQISPVKPGDFTKPVSILPPSPDAAALGKFGGIDVGMASGAPNYSVPIYEFKSRHITVPVSIHYSSTGFKVDEVATRIGNSWTLNAGGMISRIVKGNPDGNTLMRASPTASLLEMLGFIETLSDGKGSIPGVDGNTDGEADIFSFNVNGLSGQFILDTGVVYLNKKVILMNHSNVKIELGNPNDVGYDFKLTDGKGIQYYFGTREYSRLQPYNSSSDCGAQYSTDITTAWYLDKIIEPGKDTVSFTYSRKLFDYSSGISESIYKVPILDASPDDQCEPVIEFQTGKILVPVQDRPVFNDVICTTRMYNSAVAVTSITSSSGGKVDFTYSDGGDVGDRVLTGVQVFQPGQSTPLRQFTFDRFSWSNRTFLTGMKELDRKNRTEKKHIFRYYNMQEVPARLSFSQDHWGYFNGKLNYTLIPVPKSPQFKQNLPKATANREPDAQYAKKGMLSSITYPTGGKDSILYEGNTFYGPTLVVVPDTTVSVSAYVTPQVTYLNSNNFVLPDSQFVTLLAHRPPTSPTDTALSYTIVQLLNASNNNIITQLISDNPAQNTASMGILLPPGTYKLKVEIWIGMGGGTAGADIQFRPRLNYYETRNVACGGVRVSKVLTYDSVTSQPSIKRYLYRRLSDPARSSGLNMLDPQYEKYLTVTQHCYASPGDLDPGPCDYLATYHYYSMYSNSVVNLYTYPSAPTAYSTVVEGFGENFENGGIEHEFMIGSAPSIQNYLGTGIIGVSPPIVSNVHGKEKFAYTFKIRGTDTIPVRRLWTGYFIDPRGTMHIPNYVVKRNFTYRCSVTNPASFSSEKVFDCDIYRITRTWIYPDTITAWDYDDKGIDYLETKQAIAYENYDHAQPTKTSMLLSDGVVRTVKNYYPQDIALNGNAEAARISLINKHNLEAVLKQEVFHNTQLTEVTRTDFGSFGIHTMPKELFVQTGNGPAIKRMEYFAYDTKGKLLTHGKPGDVKESIIWDDNSMYPIAQVINSDTAAIAYSSFEPNSSGGWQLTSGSTYNNSAVTGKRSVTGGVRRSVPAGNYTVSFWTKATPQVNGNAVTQAPIYSSGSWKCYSVTLINVNFVEVTAASLDEIRLHPVNAQMKTLTYEPLIGSSSITDINNRITYYEYDDFCRLALVRDKDSNIVKRYAYNYAGNPDRSISYSSAQKKGTYTRSDCQSPNTGSAYEYIVPAGRYISEVSQADADSKAQADLTLNGQRFADSLGACVAPAFVNVRVYGDFYPSFCQYPNEPVAYYVDVPAGMFGGATQGDADYLAWEYAQQQADENGTCIQYVELWVDNFNPFSGYLSYSSVTSNQPYYVFIPAYSNGVVAMIPVDTYNIYVDMYPYDIWLYACDSYTFMGPDIIYFPITPTCNKIQIFQNHF